MSKNEWWGPKCDVIFSMEREYDIRHQKIKRTIQYYVHSLNLKREFIGYDNDQGQWPEAAMRLEEDWLEHVKRPLPAIAFAVWQAPTPQTFAVAFLERL